MPARLPELRWALTPPFHPHLFLTNRQFAFCGTLLEVTFTGRYPASCSVEPGLSSRVSNAVLERPSESLIRPRSYSPTVTAPTIKARRDRPSGASQVASVYSSPASRSLRASPASKPPMLGNSEAPRPRRRPSGSRRKPGGIGGRGAPLRLKKTAALAPTRGGWESPLIIKPKTSCRSRTCRSRWDSQT